MSNNAVTKYKNDLIKELATGSYQYFDKHIRKLPKDESGEFKISAKFFYDNDVDAFRHAYGSGVLVHKFRKRLPDSFAETIVNILGQIQEIRGGNTLEAQNMDLWNNAVGRKYGIATKTKE